MHRRHAETEHHPNYVRIAELERELGYRDEPVLDASEALDHSWLDTTDDLSSLEGTDDDVSYALEILTCACNRCENELVKDSLYPPPWLQDRCRTCQNMECTRRVCKVWHDPAPKRERKRRWRT